MDLTSDPSWFTNSPGKASTKRYSPQIFKGPLLFRLYLYGKSKIEEFDIKINVLFATFLQGCCCLGHIIYIYFILHLFDKSLHLVKSVVILYVTPESHTAYTYSINPCLPPLHVVISIWKALLYNVLAMESSIRSCSKLQSCVPLSWNSLTL